MEKLVLQAKAGKEEAFIELFILLQNDLYRVAQARLVNQEDVKDALQQTIMIVYKNIKKLKEPQYFKTWIIKILINECNKIYKQNSKKIRIFNRLTQTKGSQEEAVNHEYNIENKIEVETILEKLTYEEKICIVLFYNSGYSMQEIASILNTNINTIRSRIYRTKQKMKKFYKKEV